MAKSTPVDRSIAGGRAEKGFLERTINSLVAVTEHALSAEGVSSASGLLQGLDPRVKVVGLLALVVAVVLARKLEVIGGLFVIGLAMASSSGVGFKYLAIRIWAGPLFFIGVIAIPSIFIVPGKILWRIPYLNWTVSEQGLTSAAFLVTRVETAVTLSTLLILCTPWTHVMKALRTLGVPALFVVILGMTYRFVFVLLRTASDMLESRRSRIIGALSGKQQRRLAAATVGVLLSKSLQLSGEIYLAMLSRGFSGEVYLLDEFKMKSKDWAALVSFAFLAGIAFWLGR